ncbi:MAG: serpin family protein [Planctomycetaceae bacterium]
MRHVSICLLLSILLQAGCNRQEEVRREAAAKQLEQLRLALRSYRDGDVEASSVSAPSEQASSTAMNVSEIIDGSNRFAVDLYQQLRTAPGNLFFSPSSISTALAMTSAGAAGKTAEEMAKTLHLEMPPERLHPGMQSLQAFWQTPDKSQGIRLNVANRLWGQDSYEFLPKFLQITRDQYGAELARLDFANASRSRQAINSWVKDQTENKITDLVPPSAITPDTRLVLTNAVYFHGNWSDPFKEDRTKEEDFHRTADETVKVPLMHRRGNFNYGKFEGLQLLELPYGDGSFSMIVLLPEKIDGLEELEAELTFENLSRWMAGLKPEKIVEVYLPKFKTTSQFEMSRTLAAMGMTSAFDVNSADYSGMTGGKDLFLSAVIHKAFVDVNEEGTEAAAATGIVMGVTSAIEKPTEPPVFKADHPFIFMIRDNRNDVLFFLGRINDPSK